MLGLKVEGLESEKQITNLTELLFNKTTKRRRHVVNSSHLNKAAISLLRAVKFFSSAIEKATAGNLQMKCSGISSKDLDRVYGGSRFQCRRGSPPFFEKKLET